MPGSWSILSEQRTDRRQIRSDRAHSATNPCVARVRGNPRSRQKSSGQAPQAICPLLARALTVALGLIGIDFAHFFKKILRVRSRDVRRTGPATIPLLRTPRSGIDWLLHALRHMKKLRRNATKASWAAVLSGHLPERPGGAKIWTMK